MTLVNRNHEPRPQSPTPVTNIRPSPKKNDTNDEDRSPEAILASQMEEYKKVQHQLFKERKDVLIVGDSMVKYINPSKLSSSKRVACKTVPGAKVEDAYDITDKLAKTHRVSEVIFHIGTNNLQCNDHSVITAKLESLGEQILMNCSSVEMISISSIMHRRKPHLDLQKKADDANQLIRDMTSKHGWGYIDNSAIDSERHLVADGLHFNHAGSGVTTGGTGGGHVPPPPPPPIGWHCLFFCLS